MLRLYRISIIYLVTKSFFILINWLVMFLGSFIVVILNFGQVKNNFEIQVKVMELFQKNDIENKCLLFVFLWFMDFFGDWFKNFYIFLEYKKFVIEMFLFCYEI